MMLGLSWVREVDSGKLIRTYTYDSKLSRMFHALSDSPISSFAVLLQAKVIGDVNELHAESAEQMIALLAWPDP